MLMFFTLYETSFEHAITILLANYQNQTKMSGKTASAWFIYKMWQVISTIYKLFEYSFW